MIRLLIFLMHYQSNAYNLNCPKASVACPSSDMMCIWIATRDQLGKHLTTYVFNTVKPSITQLQHLCEHLKDQENQQQNQISELANSNKQLDDQVKSQQNQIQELRKENKHIKDKLKTQQIHIAELFLTKKKP